MQNSLKSPRVLRRLLILGAVVILGYWLASHQTTRSRIFPLDWRYRSLTAEEAVELDTSIYDPNLACAKLQGADDILVILKTGATEIRKKLSVHLQTTLRCVPHFVIYSDLDEKFEGQHVQDSLDGIDQDTKQGHRDFQFYRQLQVYHRGSGDFEDLLPLKDSDEANKGWNLDKWKFLPIVEKAFQKRSDAKWYVFIEADGAMFWSNLFRMLATFDAEKPLYIGAAAFVADIGFGHGGSGYAMSNPAMKSLAELIASDREFYYRLAQDEAYGDFLVAKILQQEINVNLTSVWPLLQGQSPAMVHYNHDVWCRPAVTFHHVVAEEVEVLFEYEQERLETSLAEMALPESDGLRGAKDTVRQEDPTPVVFSDVYDLLVRRKIPHERAEWDNLSEDRTYEELEPHDDFTEEMIEERLAEMSADEKEAHTSADACARTCDAWDECLQWSYGRVDDKMKCRLGNKISLGERKKGMQSAWYKDKFSAYIKSLEPCEPTFSFE